MGFFDNLLGKVGRTTVSALVGDQRPPTGPLKLSAGDFVTHYKERFAITGLRYLEGDGSKVFHYCLRSGDGTRAVLVAEDGPDPYYSLQRLVKGDVKVDADVLTDIADEPFHVVQRGKMKVKAWGDSGLPNHVRQLDYREYEDASGERVLVVEDFPGLREVRVGEPVYEAEMEFERSATPAAKPRGLAVAKADAAFEEIAPDHIVKGTPRAAAAALERNMGATKSEIGDDHDPSAYDDEQWADADSTSQPARPTRFAKPVRRSDDEDDDEWTSATQAFRDEAAVSNKPKPK